MSRSLADYKKVYSIVFTSKIAFVVNEFICLQLTEPNSISAEIYVVNAFGKAADQKRCKAPENNPTLGL